MLVEYGHVLCANLTDIHNRHAQRNPEEIKEQGTIIGEMITVVADIRETAIQLVNKLDPCKSR